MPDYVKFSQALQINEADSIKSNLDLIRPLFKLVI